jgi:hypothetical protein
MQSELTYDYPVDADVPVELRIGVRHDPSINNVESFAAILFFAIRDGTRVEVAKIDDSDHGVDGDSIHLDRYYREVGAEVKDYDIEVGGWDDAEKFLGENAQSFVTTYLQNHGEGRRTDGQN